MPGIERFEYVRKHEGLSATKHERFLNWSESTDGQRLKCACVASFTDVIVTRQMLESKRIGFAQSANSQHDLAAYAEQIAADACRLLPIFIEQNEPLKVQRTIQTVALVETLLGKARAARNKGRAEAQDDAAYDVYRMMKKTASPLLTDMYADLRAEVDAEKIWLEGAYKDKPIHKLIRDAKAYTARKILEYRPADSASTFEDRLDAYVGEHRYLVNTMLLHTDEDQQKQLYFELAHALESMIRIPPNTVRTTLARFAKLFDSISPPRFL